MVRHKCSIIMQKDNILEEIRKKIGGWFGDQDGIFAGHTLDEQRAKEHRKLAAEYGISLSEIEDLATEYFNKKGFIVEHQEEQLKRIRKFFSKLK